MEGLIKRNLKSEEGQISLEFIEVTGPAYLSTDFLSKDLF